MKYGRYSVDTVALPKSKDLRMDWEGVTMIFEVLRSSGECTFAGLVHRFIQIESFEPYRMHEHRLSA